MKNSKILRNIPFTRILTYNGDKVVSSGKSGILSYLDWPGQDRIMYEIRDNIYTDENRITVLDGGIPAIPKRYAYQGDTIPIALNGVQRLYIGNSIIKRGQVVYYNQATDQIDYINGYPVGQAVSDTVGNYVLVKVDKLSEELEYWAEIQLTEGNLTVNEIRNDFNTQFAIFGGQVTNPWTYDTQSHSLNADFKLNTEEAVVHSLSKPDGSPNSVTYINNLNDNLIFESISIVDNLISVRMNTLEIDHSNRIVNVPVDHFKISILIKAKNIIPVYNP